MSKLLVVHLKSVNLQVIKIPVAFSKKGVHFPSGNYPEMCKANNKTKQQVLFIFKLRRRTEASGAGLEGEGKEEPWLEPGKRPCLALGRGGKGEQLHRAR